MNLEPKVSSKGIWWDGQYGGATKGSRFAMFYVKPVLPLLNEWSEVACFPSGGDDIEKNYYIPVGSTTRKLIDKQERDQIDVLIDLLFPDTGTGGDCPCPPDVGLRLVSLEAATIDLVGRVDTLEEDAGRVANTLNILASTVTSNSNRITALESASGGGSEGDWPPPYARLKCISQHSPEGGVYPSGYKLPIGNRGKYERLEHHNVAYDGDFTMVVKSGMTGVGSLSCDLSGMVNWNNVSGNVAKFTTEVYLTFYNTLGGDVVLPIGQDVYTKTKSYQNVESVSTSCSFNITIPETLEEAGTGFSRFSIHLRTVSSPANSGASAGPIMTVNRPIILSFEKMAPFRPAWYRRAINYVLGRN